MHQLFVYGSLRSGFNHPAYSYMAENFTLIDNGTVKGKLYDLGDYPAAVPTTEEVFIIGELYTLKEHRDFDWTISQIDDYEGLHVEAGEIPLYKRSLTTVYLNGGTSTAWIYWYNKDVQNSPVISSGDVLEYLQQKKR
jgi:gamma-glutamylcyclotransferase (GGCT)/AIG2-like uncharacterized protein YtfP